MSPPPCFGFLTPNHHLHWDGGGSGGGGGGWGRRGKGEAILSISAARARGLQTEAAKESSSPTVISPRSHVMWRRLLLPLPASVSVWVCGGGGGGEGDAPRKSKSSSQQFPNSTERADTNTLQRGRARKHTRAESARPSSRCIAKAGCTHWSVHTCFKVTYVETRPLLPG